MSTAKYIPDRGDIIWINLNPVIGHEQSGHRPVLVVSNIVMAKAIGLAIVVPITSKVKNMPFEVPINGKTIKGAVLPFQLRTVDIKVREVRYIEKASRDTLELVCDSLNNIINK